MTAPLEKLPTEVLYNVFLFLPPTSVPRMQQVSQRFNVVSQPLLWRHYCRTFYRYWSPERSIQSKFNGDVNGIDWKRIFSDRHDLARRVDRGIDDILSEQKNRLDKAERIVTNGYDAKDALLRNLRVRDEAEDVLARRYYSDAVLGLLHRSMAIREWMKLSKGEQIPLERALAGFDMFVLHDREGDLDEISSRLDAIANEFRQDVPEHSTMKITRKAAAVAEYLRGKNLVGIQGNLEEQYHNLQNNFMGLAVQDPDHPSLPLVSVAIYCCVAQRVGLDAHPCGFPFHVIAIIEPPRGPELAREDIPEAQLETPVYMDPFRSSSELSIDSLTSQLNSLGITRSEHQTYLGSSSTAEIVRRSAKNIITSVQTASHDNRTTSQVGSVPAIEDAYYASLWALTILADDDRGIAHSQRVQFLPFIVQRVESYFPLDVSLMEENIAPLFSNMAQYEAILDTARAMRESDRSIASVVKSRIPEQTKGVRFKVGQTFQHKRYNYFAVITGWDVECRAGEDWISRMQVDQLPRGKHQSFYHVKLASLCTLVGILLTISRVEDSSPRYVAEDNIKIVDQEPTQGLMTIAGQYFKRWDGDTRVFVSNIKDEYPDD